MQRACGRISIKAQAADILKLIHCLMSRLGSLSRRWLSPSLAVCAFPANSALS
jgi:hypothetical protein